MIEGVVIASNAVLPLISALDVFVCFAHLNGHGHVGETRLIQIPDGLGRGLVGFLVVSRTKFMHIS